MGCIRREETGEWVITYRTAGGAEVELPTPAETEEEAERLLHHCELQSWAIRSTGLAMLPDPEPFRALWGWWSRTCLGRYSATWRRTVVCLVETYLLPTIGDLFAGEILPLDFQSKVQHWLDAGMKPRTANAIRSIAKTIVNDAIANRRWPMTNNPFALVRPRRVPRQIWPTLHAEDCRALLSATPGPRRTLWALALYLGLRRGELFALRREDFDLRSRAVVVHRSHDRDQTKSGIARLLPCVDELWTLIEAHVASLEDASALVFPGRAGRRLHRDYKLPRRLRADLRRAGVVAAWATRCRCGWREVLSPPVPAPKPGRASCPMCGRLYRVVGVAPQIRAHDLRHTFTTLAEQAGVSRVAQGHRGGVTSYYFNNSIKNREMN